MRNSKQANFFKATYKKGKLLDFSLLSRKQVCPKGASEGLSEETFLESFGKIETPRRVLKRYQTFEVAHKDLVETNFTEGFS